MKIFSLCILAIFIFMSSANAKPITLKFDNADLRKIIMTVASVGNLNVALDSEIKGEISIHLENVEPARALEIIAKTKNLSLIKEYGIILITKETKLIEPMQSYILPVRYGDAEILRTAIYKTLDFEDEGSDLKSVRVQDKDGNTRTYNYGNSKNTSYDNNNEDKRSRRVFVNPEVNAIILFGTQSEYERAKNLLAKLDIELKQVSVEAKILAISKTASKNLGIEWAWNTPTQRIKFGRTSKATGFELYYTATLNALITDGKAKILSRPNITTIQGREAEINVGDKIPVPTESVTNSTTTTSYEYRDAGIKLTYTPRVNIDDTITAKIHVEVTTPEYVADMGVYRFNTRSADTNITVRDGEPMIIGGLIGAEESKSISKIPILGDLPILGALFRNHKNNKSESELIIFLTAKILNGAEEIR